VRPDRACVWKGSPGNWLGLPFFSFLPLHFTRVTVIYMNSQKQLSEINVIPLKSH